MRAPLCSDNLDLDLAFDGAARGGGLAGESIAPVNGGGTIPVGDSDRPATGSQSGCRRWRCRTSAVASPGPLSLPAEPHSHKADASNS